MFIEILIGSAAGLVCGFVQYKISGSLVTRLNMRWPLFFGKLVMYAGIFAGIMMYSQTALIACATVSVIILWVTTLMRYMRSRN